MIIALVIVSLALITVYFRESNAGPLHGIQGAGATVLRPFEIAANRVAQPFRDTYGYFSSLVHAKSRADSLARENAKLLQQRIDYHDLVAENARLRKIDNYKAPPALRDLKRVNAAVITQPTSPFDQTLVISAGASDGIRQGNPVLDPNGYLVGTISLAYSRTARVTLLTDETSFVAAKDPQTGARGIVKDNGGTAGSLILDRVSKTERVREGDSVITSGFKWHGLSSLYPKGIPIGWVSSVEQVDTDYFKHVQITPLGKFSGLESVMVVATPKDARGLP